MGIEPHISVPHTLSYPLDEFSTRINLTGIVFIGCFSRRAHGETLAESGGVEPHAFTGTIRLATGPVNLHSSLSITLYS